MSAEVPVSKLQQPTFRTTEPYDAHPLPATFPLIRHMNSSCIRKRLLLPRCGSSSPCQDPMVIFSWRWTPERRKVREYTAINSMLDQINSCLDHLEEKNDHLNAQLKELLESNRQARREFQQQLSQMQAALPSPETF
ncbi:UPF0184 protein C9orf16 homolog [Rhinatrema bivittatum]|uniref:UPF0184 protein C9orf16 homolog n=1 Tax=Rhinatrema bivittatum TaxID=194408 RepID=UPI00112AF541|nr:UPF0184 protein C9orf16 homolog [Rhinatrema bivittatum]